MDTRHQRMPIPQQATSHTIPIQRRLTTIATTTAPQVIVAALRTAMEVLLHSLITLAIAMDMAPIRMDIVIVITTAITMATTTIMRTVEYQLHMVVYHSVVQHHTSTQTLRDSLIPIQQDTSTNYYKNTARIRAVFLFGTGDILLP